MNVKREDLLDAAEIGLLQYRQVDPVLIFLLQRDVQMQRKNMLTRQKGSGDRDRHWLSYAAAILAIGIATALLALYMSLTFKVMGVDGLLWFIGLYALFAVVVATWFERRGVSTAIRVFAISVIAVLPLAVLASQQVGMS